MAATRGKRAGAGDWTDYQKSAGVRLYRPDVAPAEAGEAGEVTSAPPAEAAKPRQSPAEGGKDDRPAFNNPLFGDIAAKR